MRLYYGTYGHRIHGKLYVYWGPDNLRTQQNVVAPVTNKWSGKTYNTMFTIARTQSVKNAQNEVNRLENEGIFIKTITGTESVMSLPGAKPYSSANEWRRASWEKYRKLYKIPETVKNPYDRKAKNPEIKPPKSPEKKKLSAKRKKKATVKGIKKGLNELKKQLHAYSDVSAEAKSALSKKRSAADSFRQKERIKKLKQRDAFRE